MSLRLQINLIIAAMLLAFAALLVGLQLKDTSRGVHEEIGGSNLVAIQVLSQVEATSREGGLSAMATFLQGLGRIRGNEIELFGEDGALLYRSPPPRYKAGRDAPQWYASLVAPPLKTREIALPHGRVVVRPDPSRAILDGWDDFVPLLVTLLVGVLLANGLAYWLVGRALHPFQQLAQGLRAIAQGEYATRLPRLKGREAGGLGEDFNGMAQSVQDGMLAREKARVATVALAENRELTQAIQTRIEEVRRQIARELHDDLGQQVTAIKSLGFAISHRAQGQDLRIAESARMVVQCADAMYESVHQMVSQLRPLALDRFGLADAVQDLVEQARTQHPGVHLQLQIEGALDAVDGELATAVYRIAQESLTNALRHSQAQQIALHVRVESQHVLVEVRDDGRGLHKDWEQTGHFGVIGMRERAESLNGTFVIEPQAAGGVRMRARLPLGVEMNVELDRG
ncbi:MAG: HAMP domain-containing protein [Betaproteobacteria bacterium]|nr:HAMP domain-containing protein [Betaproteobacteria bacterium]